MKTYRIGFAAFALALAACRGSNGGGDEGADDDGSDDGTEAQCEGEAVSVGPAPLRRLTRVEYDNTVRDLLGDSSRPAQEFVPDESSARFEANSTSPPSELQVSNYVAAAEALAATAVANDIDAWLSCDHAETACVSPWLADFGKRAFRRPLAQAELDTFVMLYESARDQWDAAKGIELAIAAMLASPQFLYHLELGVPAENGEDVVALDGYELASRLSYFLWSSMPDDTLLAAAEAGELATREGVEQHARRMLADGKAGDTIESFHRQWLELAGIENGVKDPEMFPEWDADLALAMQDETYAFARHVIGEGDARLETLLSASYSFVSDDLAAIYGVSGGGEQLAKVDFDPNERAGFLTQASFLASRAHETEPSWVHRGLFVRTRLLCQDLPPPPPGVEQTMANNPDRLENETCSGCHLLIDPIGKGFDGYDSIGRYRPFDDGGEAIDQSGEVFGAGEAAGVFDGPVDLAHQLAASDDVRDCVATQWFSFATKRAPEAADDCSVGVVRTSFVESDGDVRELLIALATTDAFRYRPAFANAP